MVELGYGGRFVDGRFVTPVPLEMVKVPCSMAGCSVRELWVEADSEAPWFCSDACYNGYQKSSMLERGSEPHTISEGGTSEDAEYWANRANLKKAEK